MITKFVRHAVPVIAGGLAGLVATLIAASSPARRVDRLEPPRPESEVAAPPAVDESASRALQAALLRHAMAAPTTSPPPAAAADEPHPSAADRERKSEEEVREHERKIARHESEIRNPAWSSSFEQTLERRFSHLSDGTSARFETADCRSSTCTVTVSWPTRDDAQRELAPLMRRTAGLPCSREMVLPPSGGDGRYSATMWLDCSSSDTNTNGPGHGKD